ncbi:MAG: DUF1552 domain-containing protein [Deltaproteobacteria bacterium]|nr:DUF1552 domain-containing protein [Deltaproteobacteria bacterium]
MLSYKFARRSFLRGIGAATGLKIMLDNLEASAQGAKSPPRFLMTHFSQGTAKPDFLPAGPGGKDFTFSRILKPFETAGLREQMIILYGLDNSKIGGFGGASHERGTVMMSTAVAPPGTRAGLTEGDDAFAGGPSFDQIFLKHVPGLYKASSGKGYVNAICDSRVDAQEISNQCISYGYTTQPQAAARGAGPQNTPLLPELSPLNLYMSIFSGFVPGGGTPGNTDALKKALMQRKSVLDFALRELKTIKSLAPASEGSKIDLHTDAVQKVNTKIVADLQSATNGTSTCALPPMPDNTMGVANGKVDRNDFANFKTLASDEVTHEKVGTLHMGIIRAAFQCDLLRVATFQWSPGTNHVSFKGLWPGEPETSYMHHPPSHRIPASSPQQLLEKPDPAYAPVVEFLTQVQIWYFTRMAKIINEFKTTTDAFGGNLLDHTIIPYVTEVGTSTHHFNNTPALIFGGGKLGMQLGQFMNLGSRVGPDLWLTIAQAYGLDVTKAPLSAEKFAAVKANYTGPIAGLWKTPVV